MGKGGLESRGGGTGGRESHAVTVGKEGMGVWAKEQYEFRRRWAAIVPSAYRP
jgi:hypothetical protein